MKMQVRIPVLTGNSQIDIDRGSSITVTVAELLEIDDTRSTIYTLVNEASTERLYQRTIYRKGRNESQRIGVVMIDLPTGLYSLKVDDPLNRPAGLDLQLTLQINSVPRNSHD